MIELWLMFALLSLLTSSFTTLLQRVVLRKRDSDPLSYSIVFQVLSALFISVFALYQGFSLAGAEKVIPNLLVMPFIYAAATLALFKALKLSDASSVTIINGSRSFWQALGAIVLLNEVITLKIGLGTILVIAGVAVVFYRSGGLKLSKGNSFALLAAVLYGLGFANDAFIVGSINVTSYLALAFYAPALLLIVVSPRKSNIVGFLKDKSTTIEVLALSFLWAVGSIAVLSAFKLGGAAVQVYPIVQSSIILTVILASIFLNERTNLLNKIVGMLLVFVGVVLLA